MNNSTNQTPPERGNNNVPATKIWKDLQPRLKRAIGLQDYQKWVSNLDFIGEVDGRILLMAPDQLTRDRVRDNFGRVMNSAWITHDPRGRRLIIQIEDDIEPTTLELVRDRINAARARQRRPILKTVKPTPLAERQSSTSRVREMTLETLVQGEANAIGVNLVRRLLNGDPPPAGIVTLHGPHGIGKTHLLRALEQGLIEAGRGDEVVYITADEFLNAYVDGVRSGDTRALKARVRGATMILFDDLQNVSGKKGTEQEFFDTLRAVTQRAPELPGYMIIAADAHPDEISGLSPRIRGDLNGGVLIGLDLPDAEMRRAIVESKVALIQENEPNFALTPDMIDKIVYGADDSARVVTGMVVNIFTDTVYIGRQVTDESVEKVIARSTGRREKPKIDQIKRAVCDVLEVSHAQIVSSARPRPVCRARHLIMYLSRKLTDKSFPQIAIALGNMHHTSVIHGERVIRKLLASRDADTAAKRATVQAQLDLCMQALRKIQAETQTKGR